MQGTAGPVRHRKTSRRIANGRGYCATYPPGMNHTRPSRYHFSSILSNARVLIELSAKTLLCVSNPRQRLERDLEFPVAQRAHTGNGHHRKPFGDSKIVHCHEQIIKPGGGGGSG
jgi:hypothetical protein